MLLVVEKYRTESGLPPEPIKVLFMRNDRECLVSAIIEFLKYNFDADHPPKYRDSEGDMILLETREAFEGAVDDILRTKLKMFIVHVDGCYKCGPKKDQAAEAGAPDAKNNEDNEKPVPVQNRGTSTAMNHCVCGGCFAVPRDDSLHWLREEIQHNVRRGLEEVLSDMNSWRTEHRFHFRDQKANCSSKEDKSTQTLEPDNSDDGVGTSLISRVGSDYSSIGSDVKLLGTGGKWKDGLWEFEVLRETPVWDVSAYYAKKGIISKHGESSQLERGEEKCFDSSFDMQETIRRGEKIYSKRWIIRRIAPRSWENVSVVAGTVYGPLEMYSLKVIVTNTAEKEQIVDFSLWMRGSSSTEYASVYMQLYENTSGNKHRIIYGPKLFFEINWKPTKSDVGEDPIEQSLTEDDTDSYSPYEMVMHDEDNNRDHMVCHEQVEEYASCDSSDFEVINGDDDTDNTGTHT